MINEVLYASDALCKCGHRYDEHTKSSNGGLVCTWIDDDKQRNAVCSCEDYTPKPLAIHHDPSSCKHEDFRADVQVNRLPLKEGGPIENYSADVRVECANCGTPFRFMGLPYGLDLRGAAVSVDGEEGLAIAPKGAVVNAIEGIGGFTVKRTH